jgi:HD superfamily phosphohydrolase
MANTKSRVATVSSGDAIPSQGLLVTRGIDLKPHKTSRIAVSGDVMLNRLETNIIDTPDFQRLRRIRQLGTTYLVFPTALHTRFDHSLGTLEMAARMIRAIRDNRHNSDDERNISEEDEQLIRLLALLHDVTHIPFGHTLEDECSVFDRHDANARRINRFLDSGSAIGTLIKTALGESFYQRFMKTYLTSKKDLALLGEDAYIYDIVNNTVCADLLDYLRRDCYFCNLVLDMEYRFLNYLYLLRTGSERRVVIRLWKKGTSSPRPDVLSELVRLLDNRYLLGERVYFHRAKLVSGAMLADAVQREKNAGLLSEEDLWEIGDDVFLARLADSKLEPVSVIGRALQNRHLWKQIYERNRNWIDTEQSEHRDIDVMAQTMELWWKDAKRRQEDQDYLSGCIGLPAGRLLLYCPDERMNLKLAEMKVLWNGSLQELAKCADEPVVGPKLRTILESHRQLWAIRGFLAPEHLDQTEACKEGLNYLLSFDPHSRDLAARDFYSKVVARVAASARLNDLPHSEFQRYEDDAVSRIMANTASNRTPAVVEEIIKNAFTRTDDNSTT